MTIQNHEKAIVDQYFADFYKWITGVTVLFSVAYIIFLLWGEPSESWGGYYLIPGCYLLMLFVSLRYFILYFTALRDMRLDRIEESTICVEDFIRDKYCYKNSGGAMVGTEKCALIDSAGSKYRVVLDEGFIVEMRPKDYYKHAQVVVKYLSRSRIVLHMQVRSSKTPDIASRRLKNDLQSYF